MSQPRLRAPPRVIHVQRMSPVPPIRHDPGRRFWLELNGEVAYLAYRFVDERTVDYASTWTPHTLRGRGIATRLAHHALAWAREQDLTVIPTCWFVRKVLTQTGPQNEGSRGI